MGKGSGGGGGGKGSGGAGGRSASRKGTQSWWKAKSWDELAPGEHKKFLAAMGGQLMFYIAAGAAFDMVQAYGYEGAKQAASYKTKEAINNAGKAFAKRVAPVTEKMRDKVRAWAQRKAAEEAAKASNPGAINTDGVAMHAVKGLLGNGKFSDAVPKGAKSPRIGAIPDRSYIQFKKGGNIYKGSDIKTLMADATRAGAREVRDNRPGRYESAARKINLGAVKGKGPRRKKT